MLSSAPRPAALSPPSLPLLPLQESLDSPIDRRSDYYRRSALLQQFQGGALPPPQPLLTPPNVCTLARVALVPIFVILWHTVHEYASIATAVVFILAALTDWLDGYLARRVRHCGGCDGKRGARVVCGGVGAPSHQPS